MFLRRGDPGFNKGSTIFYDEMLPILVEACPSFEEKWIAHQTEYSDEENFLPYIALAALARHLVELEKSGETKEFEAVFVLVEQIHVEGTPAVKEAITIGFLEDLQNILGGDIEKFEKYLKPESMKWRDQLNKFWEGEIKFVGETID